jgi:hypothetical protein
MLFQKTNHNNLNNNSGKQNSFLSSGNLSSSNGGRKNHESEKLNKNKVPFSSMDVTYYTEIPHFDDLVDHLKT